MQNLKKNWLLLWKMTWGIWQIFIRYTCMSYKRTRSTQRSQKFVPEYIMFELKKNRGVMFDCTQDWYKVWSKTGMCFQKMTWETWQIFTRALESLQIETLMASFCLKLKIYELKTYRGVMCHGNEEWFKIWNRIDFHLKIDMRNLTNFDLSRWKSQKYAL